MYHVASTLELDTRGSRKTPQCNSRSTNRNNRFWESDLSYSYDNTALQAQWDAVQAELQKYQDHLHDLITNHYDIWEKNHRWRRWALLFTTPKEDLYFIVWIQRQFIATKRRWFSAQYSHIRFVLEDLHTFYSSNIYAFNRFEKEGHIKQFQCDFRLFKLERDALHALFTLALQSWWLRFIFTN